MEDYGSVFELEYHNVKKNKQTNNVKKQILVAVLCILGNN